MEGLGSFSFKHLAVLELMIFYQKHESIRKQIDEDKILKNFDTSEELKNLQKCLN